MLFPVASSSLARVIPAAPAPTMQTSADSICPSGTVFASSNMDAPQSFFDRTEIFAQMRPASHAGQHHPNLRALNERPECGGYGPGSHRVMGQNLARNHADAEHTCTFQERQGRFNSTTVEGNLHAGDARVLDP